MGTHADLTRPVDTTIHSPRPWAGDHRAEGQPLLGQTEAVIADLGDTSLALVMVITCEDRDDGVYLTTAPCADHGAHDFYAQWDGEAVVVIDGGDESLAVPLLTFIGHAEV